MNNSQIKRAKMCHAELAVTLARLDSVIESEDDGDLSADDVGDLNYAAERINEAMAAIENRIPSRN